MSTPEVHAPSLEDDRRSGGDRRADAAGGRRTDDHYDRFRSAAATVLAFAGGLAILYLFLAAIGAFDPGDAIVASVVAIVLAAIWLVGAFQRYRSGAQFITRRERERRGF